MGMLDFYFFLNRRLATDVGGENAKKY